MGRHRVWCTRASRGACRARRHAPLALILTCRTRRWGDCCRGTARTAGRTRRALRLARFVVVTTGWAYRTCCSFLTAVLTNRTAGASWFTLRRVECACCARITLGGSLGAICSLGTNNASLVGHSTNILGVRARRARQLLVGGGGAVGAAAGTEVSCKRLGALVLIKVAALRAFVHIATCNVGAIAVGGHRADSRAAAD